MDPVPGFRARRITFVHPVQVKVIGSDQPPALLHATNLSTGGMFIYSVEPFPPGTRLQIALEVRGRALAFADAEVRWSRDSAFISSPWCPGFGVRFTRLSPKAQALVGLLVSAAIHQSIRRPRPQEPEQVEGVPVPAENRLPAITPDDPAPANDNDFSTKVMYPPPELAEMAANATGDRTLKMGVVQPPPPRRPASGWRWVRWGLALLATAAWVAAFSQASPASAARAAADRVIRPAPSSARR